MKKNQTLKTVAGLVILFFVLVGITIYLSASGKITVHIALLMLFALLGIYVGFGVLIGVYQLVNKL